MRHLKTTLALLGAVTVLVLAGNTIAMATTGHAFILGKINSANKQTTLTRTTNGPVLKLNAKQATGVPLAVKGTGKVTNLNADRVDGLDSSTLKTTAYVFTRSITVATTSVTIAVPLPAGKYVVSYSAYLDGAESGNVDCYLEQNPAATTSTYSGESRFTAGTPVPGLSGTGYIDQSHPGDVTSLHCNAANAFTTFSNEPIQIVATRIDAASGPTAARIKGARTTAH